jgi:hypothetical protein
MFNILQDLDDSLFYVYYSGTLLEAFDSFKDAELFVNTTKMEMETYYGA